MRVVCTLLSCALCTGKALASSLFVTVTDSNGQRLEHAVISVHGKVPQVATNQSLAIMDQRNR